MKSQWNHLRLALRFQCLKVCRKGQFTSIGLIYVSPTIYFSFLLTVWGVYLDSCKAFKGHMQSLWIILQYLCLYKIYQICMLTFKTQQPNQWNAVFFRCTSIFHEATLDLRLNWNGLVLRITLSMNSYLQPIKVEHIQTSDYKQSTSFAW